MANIPDRSIEFEKIDFFDDKVETDFMNKRLRDTQVAVANTLNEIEKTLEHNEVRIANIEHNMTMSLECHRQMSIELNRLVKQSETIFGLSNGAMLRLGHLKSVVEGLAIAIESNKEKSQYGYAIAAGVGTIAGIIIHALF